MQVPWASRWRRNNLLSPNESPPVCSRAGDPIGPARRHAVMAGLRIIAGELKGRRLRVPRAGVRPTGEKVREALFDILGTGARDARVLDLYSGSGALGLEALSRGAREVVFVEADRESARILALNVESLGGGPRCRVHHAEVLEALAGRWLEGRFELIFADPPYGGDEPTRMLPLIADLDLLVADGLLVVERRTRRPPEDGGPLNRVRTARYGDTSLDFYRG